MEVAEYEKMYRFEETNWWYKGKRELTLAIVNGIKNKSRNNELNILDAGCGTGLNLKSLERYGKVVGLDSSEKALRFSRSRGISSLICSDVESLPFKDESFEIICALDVLEHIEDDIAATKEFFRILKPEGILIVTVPAFQFLWSEHDLALHHRRRYNRKLFLKRLELSGFCVEFNSYWNFFLFPMVTFMRLLRKREDQEVGTDLKELPAPSNELLLNILRVEKSLIMRHIALPIGVSILCVCRKRREDKNGSLVED